MKKLWNTLVLTLAVNFIALAAAVAWFYKTGRLDREKTAAIKKIVFAGPQPGSPKDAALASAATTQPALRLDALLEKHTGKRAGEQVEVIQQAFDAQTALLGRRR